MRNALKLFILLLCLSPLSLAQINSIPHPRYLPNSSFGLDKLLERTLTKSLQSKRYNGVKMGVVVKRAKGPIIFAKNHEDLFIPASTVKVMTAAASMLTFTPHYRFNSEIRYNGTLEEGLLTGDLYFVGFGDPVLNDEKLKIAVKHIYYKGVREIKGTIYYDAGYFDQVNPSYFPDARHYHTPPSALSINLNQVKLKHVTDDVFVMSPDTAYAQLEGITKFAKKQPEKRARIVYRKTDAGDVYRIEGAITQKALNNGYFNFAVTRPGLYAATRFKEHLIAHGIKVSAPIKEGYMPRKTVLLEKIMSENLFDINKTMLNKSDNMIAEVIIKNMGAVWESEPGTTKKGVKVMKDILHQRANLDRDSYTLVDASGLSNQNRLSPMHLINLMEYAFENPYLRDAMITVLPKVGVDIDDRHIPLPSFMDVHMKSGTLSGRGVNTLVGFINDKTTQDLFLFVIFANREVPGPLTLSGTLTTPILNDIIDVIRE